MSDPVLHLVAGPNGTGKSTFVQEVLGPVTRLPFVNADEIAARLWPGAEVEHAYEAAGIASAERGTAIERRRSFITETVFSHPSKLGLIEDANAAGYRVTLHIVLVPEDLAVARVENRVEQGGHYVPEDKVRARFGRLWINLRQAIRLSDETFVYDNTRAARPFRVVASYADGGLVGPTDWPAWTPNDLLPA
jgi:predicted ABC-type ATPase